jgi:guanylate kinase
MADKKIFVFTGPDGSGRKTVANMVGITLDIPKVISYSTRERRPGEVDGADYHFISKAKFLAGELCEEFIECVEMHHNFYGVKRRDIESLMHKHQQIYIVVNTEGAEKLKKLYPDQIIRLFIYADKETVNRRQQEAGLSELSRQRNWERYEKDMSYMAQCEHAFENYELAHTVFDVTQTLEAYLERDLVEKD